jgi:hypothetical protein
MNHVQVLIFPVLSFWCMVNPSGSQPHSMIQPSCIILGLSYLFLCHAGQVPLCCSQRQMVLLLVQANCGVHRHSGWACGALLLRSANVWPASDLVFSPFFSFSLADLSPSVYSTFRAGAVVHPRIWLSLNTTWMVSRLIACLQFDSFISCADRDTRIECQRDNKERANVLLR